MSIVMTAWRPIRRRVAMISARRSSAAISRTLRSWMPMRRAILLVADRALVPSVDDGGEVRHMVRPESARLAERDPHHHPMRRLARALLGGRTAG